MKVTSSSLGNMNNFNISGFNNNTDKTTFPGSNDVDPFSENDPFKDEDPFKDGEYITTFSAWLLFNTVLQSFLIFQFNYKLYESIIL